MLTRWKRKRPRTQTSTSPQSPQETESDKHKSGPPSIHRYDPLQQILFGYNQQELAQRKQKREEIENSRSIQLAHKMLQKKMENDLMIVSMLRHPVNIDKMERERKGLLKVSGFSLEMQKECHRRYSFIRVIRTQLD